MNGKWGVSVNELRQLVCVSHVAYLTSIRKKQKKKILAERCLCALRVIYERNEMNDCHNCRPVGGMGIIENEAKKYGEQETNKVGYFQFIF